MEEMVMKLSQLLIDQLKKFIHSFLSKHHLYLNTNIDMSLEQNPMFKDLSPLIKVKLESIMYLNISIGYIPTTPLITMEKHSSIKEKKLKVFQLETTIEPKIPNGYLLNLNSLKKELL